MRTIKKVLESDDMLHEYVTIKAGSMIEMASPEWDGDKPETHLMLHVVLHHDISVCMADNEFNGTIVKEFDKPREVVPFSNESILEKIKNKTPCTDVEIGDKVKYIGMVLRYNLLNKDQEYTVSKVQKWGDTWYISVEDYPDNTVFLYSEFENLTADLEGDDIDDYAIWHKGIKNV